MEDLMKDRPTISTEEKTDSEHNDLAKFAMLSAQSYANIIYLMAALNSSPESKTDSFVKHEENLIQVACTIASNMGFIKQVKSYIPEEEFKLLTNSILPPSDLQEIFFSQLMTISDLIIQRKEWINDSPEIKSHFQTALDALVKLKLKPNYSYLSSYLIRSENSPTIKFLFETITNNNREGYFRENRLIRTDEDTARILDKYFNPTKETEKFLNKNYKPRNFDTDLKQSLKKLFSQNYIANCRNLSTIFEILQNRFNSHNDKVTFFKMLLTTLQYTAEYDDYTPSIHRNKPIPHIKTTDNITNIFYSIFVIAKNTLGLNEIKAIIKEMNFQVKIFEKDFNEVNQYFLPIFISFIKDEISPYELLNSSFFSHVISSRYYNYLCLTLDITGEKAFHEFNLDLASSTGMDSIPFSLPLSLLNMALTDKKVIEFLIKLKKDIDQTPHLEPQNTPLVVFTRRQNEIKQVVLQLQLSDYFLTEELNREKISIEKMLDGLYILGLDDVTIPILSTYFKNHTQEKNNFIENVCKLAAIVEAHISLPLNYKRNVFNTATPSEKQIKAFLDSLQPIATNWPDLIHSIPLLLLNRIALDLTLIDPLTQLQKKFEKCNEKLRMDGHPGLNMKEFIADYENQIDTLIQLTGRIGADHIQKQIIGTSLLPLERILSILPGFDNTFISGFSPYFKLHLKKDTINTLINCLAALLALSVMRSSLQNDPIDFYLQISHNKNPNEFLFETIKIMLKTIFPDRKEILEEFLSRDKDALLKKITMEDLSHLCLAASDMMSSEYNPFFLELLWNDLMGISNDAYLHDINQEDPLGKQIALHNDTIQKTLIHHLINPAKALASYQDTRKSVDLIIWPTSMPDADKVRANQLVALWNYLLKVEESLTQSSQMTTESSHELADKKDAVKSGSISTIPELTNIKKYITELKTNIKKQQQNEADQSAIISALSSNVGIGLVNKTNKTFASLIVKKISVNKTFEEFSEHVTNHLKVCLLEQKPEETKPAKDEKNKKEKMKPKFIQIRQWDKSNPRTFFLGDDVSCCLATTGSQFQAMVQRRLDDALFFFMATDQSQKEPVALIWCYLAETENDDIVLMANFFEVRVNIGINDHFRHSVLYGLLEFTNQYLKDNPNIKGLYMNQLSYGLNKGDLDAYLTQPISLHDKLGGSIRTIINPTEAFLDPKELTTKHYYLKSLEQTDFHVFDSKILYKDRPKSIMTVNELISSFVSKKQGESKEWIRANEMLKQLVTEHEIELAPFYNKPLLQNTRLISLVSHELEFYIVKKILKEKQYPEDEINDTYGITALHLAVKCRDIDAVNALFQNKYLRIDANIKSNTGMTPVSLAAESGFPDMVKALLENKEYGVDPNIRDEDERTPLHKAASLGKVAVIKELLANPDNKALDLPAPEKIDILLILADEKKRTAFKQLLNGKNINISNATHLQGITPLHAAICFGNVEAVKLIINAGFNIQQTTADNISGLEFATALNHLGIIKLLTAILKLNEFNIETEEVKRAAIKTICASENEIQTATEIIHNLYRLKQLEKYGMNSKENQITITEAGNNASDVGYQLWESKVGEMFPQQKKNRPVYPHLQGHAASALRYAMFASPVGKKEMKERWNAISSPFTADEKQADRPNKATPFK